LLSVTRDPDLSSLRWTVDYQEDLEFVRAVYGALADRAAFGMGDILALLERRPELRRTASEVARNEGYQRSVASDGPSSEETTTVERISELERRYVLEVLETQFRSSVGSEMTRRLEEAFAKRCNVRFAIAHVNGTATLHAALVAAGVGPGDEVIVPPLTMASTAFAVLHANAVPVFADIDADMWTIDPGAVEQLISPRTRAVMPVALYGLMPDMDPLMKIAERHSLVVVEDDAECFLGYYHGRVSGSIGHLASFSFQSSKQLTSGEGGIVVTDDEELALRVRRFNSLGYAGVGTNKAKITKEDIQDPQYARHVSMGFNYRMPELCAAVALAQTERIGELVGARMQAAAALAAAAETCDWLVPQRTPPGYVHSYWTYVVRLAEHAPVTWHQFRDAFRAIGGDGIYAAWRLNYLEPAFLEGKLYGQAAPFAPARRRSGVRQRYAPGLCPIAEQVQPRLLQFKTNYWDPVGATRQAEILRAAIRACERRGAVAR